MKKLLIMAFALVLTLTLVGCNPFGNDDDDDNYTGPVAVNAPANAAAFNGVKMSFNPTITFSSDGTTHTFTYVNNSTDTGTSIFPDAAGATLSGTYSYTADATDKRKGVIAFTFTDTSKNFSLELMSFTGFSTAITGLEIKKVGDSSNNIFKVQVLEGTLAPQPASTSTGTGTGTGTSTGGTDATTPDSLKGQVKNLTFGYKAQTVPTGFPYNNDDVVVFTFSSSSLLMIGSNPSRDLGTPKKYPGSEEIVWFDSQYNLFYALSLKTDGTLNEINVYSDPSKTPVSFYGQFYQK